MTLRDYQAEDVESIFSEWNRGSKSTLYVAATGLGKTRVMTEVARRVRPGRTIFLCHRGELIQQAREAFINVGMECEIEKADLYASTNLFTREPVVLAMVQTLNSGAPDSKRMKRFDPMDFALLLYDECFPAGTMIDGTPIERIKEGALVNSVSSNGIVKKPVTHIFKRRPERLLKITFASGDSVVCTPEHPIWDETRNAFTAAKDIDTDSMVLRLTTDENISFSMHYLQRAFCGKTSNRESVFSRVQSKAILAGNGFDQPDARLSQNDDEQSHETIGVSPENVLHFASYRTSPGGFGWEWSASNTAGNEDGVRIRLVNRSCCENGVLERRERLAKPFQNRCSQSPDENRNRDRRHFSWTAGEAISRQEERGVLVWDRVESIEILEPTSDGKFGGMCPDGYVYNIEVADTCTYFAAGVLVHNSHHSVSPGNKSIVDYFVNGNPNLKVLGVTATPSRGDEEALGQIFETVANERGILFGIRNGWLVDVEQQFVPTELDWSHVSTQSGDLHQGELSKIMESEEGVQNVVQPTLEALFRLPQRALDNVPVPDWGKYLLDNQTKRRRAIVFTVSVLQAETLSNIFNRVIDGISRFVSGKTSDERRAEVFSEFGSGSASILVNVGVTTEGYDNPACDMIVMARPTKSFTVYSQQIGRGTRVLPGVVDGISNAEQRLAAIAASDKPSMLVMDFVGNSGKHILISSADLLGGTVSEEAVERVVDRAKQDGKPVRIMEAAAEEEEKLRKEAEQRRIIEEARRQKLVARTRYSTVNVNPFDVLSLTPEKQRSWHNGKALSEKQRNLLAKQGIDPDSLNYAAGRQIINTLFHRWNHELATFKQCKVVKKHFPEVDTNTLTAKDATLMIGKLAANGWKRPQELQHE